MVSCEYCRSRHLKCDERLPRCSRCERVDQECRRETRETFRPPNKKSFAQKQIWVPIPPKVDFIFEAPQNDDEGSHSLVRQEEYPEEAETSRWDATDGFVTSYRPHSFLDSQKADAPNNTLVELSNGYELLSGESNYYHRQRNSKPDSLVSTYLADKRPFLQGEQDVRLFRHFIDHLSHFFDFVDGDRHFAREAPQRARHNQPLAQAMLALSARHLNRTSSFDSYVADQYLQTCVEMLIPVLNNANAVADDSLFAAVVILRFLEEVNVPITGVDTQGHLIGTQALIAASQRSSPRVISSFRRACYGCAFRQELYISMMQQRSPQWRIPASILATEPSDDWSWARRAVEHVADVLQFAFGNNNEQTYDALMEQVTVWQQNCPPGFEPLFTTANPQPEVDKFPRIHLQLDGHVMGRTYNLISHALLTAYGPRPRIGPSRKRAIQMMNDTIRNDVRLLCGVALGNPQAPAACLVASMAINLLGDRFEDVEEQKALYNMLMETETRHGWPTGVARKELELAWTGHASNPI